MEKALGFRLMDSIKEVTELEMSQVELTSALYLRKTEEKIKLGKESIENSLKSQASVYGVNFEKYKKRVQNVISNYEIEIEKIRAEYEFQFVNLQLELRETLANQKIALVNAKKITDMKKEFIESDKYKKFLSEKKELVENLNNALEKSNYDYYVNLIKNLVDPVETYNQKKESAMKKFNDSYALINSCEAKIKYCMDETYSEIDKIIKENVENSLVIPKENGITKIINKIVNLFSGKSKFENKIKQVENNMNALSSNVNEKIEKIRNNTIELVAEIQVEKEELSGQAA